MNGRILFVINHAGFFCSHRLPLALAAQSEGYDVHVATPRSKHVRRITDAGLPWSEIHLSRSGRNPFAELRSLASLHHVYRKLRPDLIHHVTSKPVLYGTLLARAMKVPAVVNAISGLGHVFSEESGPHRFFQKLVTVGYGLLLRHPRMRVIFQNVDHQRSFLQHRWVTAEQCVLIPGSGVDTSAFTPTPRSSGGTPMVLFASRMLYTKGVEQFVEAARMLRSSSVDARFVLVGEPDPDNPASVPESELRRWQGEGVVEYWGRHEDMHPVFAQADVVCLPTYYPEGIPKVLIEAAASGIPIVTTDTPGCREIVQHGENGLLVPVKDSAAVALAIQTLLSDRPLREKMGRRGRELALDRYSLRMVVDRTLAIYQELIP